MSIVVTLEDYRPPDRHDSEPWTEARIYEATTITGSYTLIDTKTLSPVDADPASPQLRSFTTSEGTAADLWYRIVFADANGDESIATIPVQNTQSAATTYATVDELARILKIRTPTADQTVALQRVLDAAAGEISSEIDLDDDDVLEPWQIQLATEVNLERAVEHWQQQEHAFGIIGLGDTGAVYTARDSWDRHAHKLAPLKSQWGMA